MDHDVIIIGGGAAGLFCAFNAGRRGKSVLVIEHNAEVGRKILISGGGRCNFTNRDVGAENFVSTNPHFAKSALAGYTPQDFLALVKRHRIGFFEKTLGQLFCRESSRQIVEMLLSECGRARVTIRTGCSVKCVSHDGRFMVETSDGSFSAGRLVVACGGLSFAKVGATDLGYRIARQFGHKIVETRPSLVALAAKGQNWPNLAGVSADAVVSTGKHSFRENILFTHRGLSGPAILQISNYWRKDRPVEIDLLPGVDVAAAIKSDRAKRRSLANYLARSLPQRLADHIAASLSVNKPIDQLSNADIELVASSVNAWQVEFDKTEGYDRAEVTLGGVSTDELSSQTMESKRQPGLYFIGEVVDVTGWLGGYNFQWAWSSGFAAAAAL
ncbi:MAG: NAD(P)/FAD-dependent oxidoreductase [Pyrinomonadaceae bacterium]|nr:NAD(P)/FAD-dependent oxidoreductase [Pyrinomonadaceae bacterium]